MTTFKDYKEAIIAHYQIVNKKDVTGVLLNPTPAQLRDFCILKLDGISSADESVLKAFFDIKKDDDLKRSIERSNIDKFRPVISFLKEQNDPDNSVRVELAAILIGFNERPYAKFSGLKIDVMNGETNSIVSDMNKPDTSLLVPKKKFKWLILLLIVIGLFGVGYTIKDVFLPQKECMQWQKDHYEVMDCDSEINNLFVESSIMPIDNSVLYLKKIEITANTTFFKGGKAVVWYCKVNGNPECFDSPGFHPVTGKALRPITDYIIQKYFAN